MNIIVIFSQPTIKWKGRVTFQIKRKLHFKKVNRYKKIWIAKTRISFLVIWLINTEQNVCFAFCGQWHFFVCCTLFIKYSFSFPFYHSLAHFSRCIPLFLCPFSLYFCIFFSTLTCYFFCQLIWLLEIYRYCYCCRYFFNIHRT